MDYPGVTKVIQVGAPRDRDTYIHRIGRTGRAGKSGEAIMILAHFEKEFIKELHNIPIKDHQLPPSELEIGQKEKRVFEYAEQAVPEGLVGDTFTSMLGFCISGAFNY